MQCFESIEVDSMAGFAGTAWQAANAPMTVFVRGQNQTAMYKDASRSFFSSGIYGLYMNC
jgi:hypothetical protein